MNQPQASPSHLAQRVDSPDREIDALFKGNTTPPTPRCGTGQDAEGPVKHEIDTDEDGHQSPTPSSASDIRPASPTIPTAEVGSRAKTAIKTPPKAHLDESDADVDESDGAETEAWNADNTVETLPPRRQPGMKASPGITLPTSQAPADRPTTAGKSPHAYDYLKQRLTIISLKNASKEDLEHELDLAGLDTEGSKSELKARVLLYLCALDPAVWQKRCMTLWDDMSMVELKALLKSYGRRGKGRVKPELVSQVLDTENDLKLYPKVDEPASPAASTESTSSSKSLKRKSDDMSDPDDSEQSPIKRRKSQDMIESQFNAFINGGADDSSQPSPTPRHIRPIKKSSHNAAASPPAGPSAETKKVDAHNDIVTNGHSTKASKKPKKHTSTSKTPRMTKPVKSIATDSKRIEDRIGWDFFTMVDGAFDSRIFFEHETPTPEALHALFHIMTGHPHDGDSGILHAFRLKLSKYKEYCLNQGQVDPRHRSWLRTQKIFLSRLPY